MKFIWDENKLKSNLEKHGLDFDIAEDILSVQSAFDMIDDRFDYDEERHLVYSELDGVKLCMCYTFRGDEIRVISIRKVHNKEWRKYYGDSDI